MTHKCIGWFDMPYTTAQPRIRGEYLYLVGGYNTVDAGCPPWGTNKDFEGLFIGDKAGDLLVLYENGQQDKLPLIFGYTLWFKRFWADSRHPFAQDQRLYDLLNNTLQLYGAIDAQSEYILKVKIRPLPIAAIEVLSSHDKVGSPVFTKGRCEDNDNFLTQEQKAFFKTHYANAKEPIPKHIFEQLDEINRALMTYEADFCHAPELSYPPDHTDTKIIFSGTPFANIATGVFMENVKDLLGKIDENGFVHESTQDAPTWWYDGFGSYKINAGIYYNQQYARNYTAVVSTLSRQAAKKLKKAVDHAHKCLMTPVERNLTIKGVPIPGHWTMAINDYDFYQRELTFAGWPTAYTEGRFGREHKNMGSMETDGHGLMMIMIYTWWRDCCRDPEWVKENWVYINEAAGYILWSLEHPECSLSKDGLLYGESEAGMQEYTMHLNVPCYVGLKMYAQMAKAAGKTEAAQKWQEAADSMEKAMLRKFSDNEKWLVDYFGFYHDPFLATVAENSGYDLKHSLDAKLYALSANSFLEDLDQYIKDTYVGPRGTGYDQSLITQNALLLDRVDYAEKLVNNLMKICYSPRLPKPYIVPECSTYSPSRQVFRRQGDLGNLVHQSMTLKTLKIMAGISLPEDGAIKLLPRLVKGWKADVQNAKIPADSGVISYSTAYPVNNTQTAKIKVENSSLGKLCFRSGPFDKDVKLQGRLNGEICPLSLDIINEHQWAWAKFDICSGKDYNLTISPES